MWLLASDGSDWEILILLHSFRGDAPALPSSACRAWLCIYGVFPGGLAQASTFYPLSYGSALICSRPAVYDAAVHQQPSASAPMKTFRQNCEDDSNRKALKLLASAHLSCLYAIKRLIFSAVFFFPAALKIPVINNYPHKAECQSYQEKSKRVRISRTTGCESSGRLNKSRMIKYAE